MRLRPMFWLFFLFAFIAFLFTGSNAYGQTKSEIAHSKKIYEGTWYSKNEKRYIRIYYDDEVNYVTINDWIKGKRDGADVYKAFVKGEKLILYAEIDNHRAPYCEIEIVNSKLMYQCNKMNFTDNFLHTKEPGDKMIFERIKKQEKKHCRNNLFPATIMHEAKSWSVSPEI